MQRHVLISCASIALLDGNLRLVNTRFGLPKIVLKIIVGEIVRCRVTIFLLDGSLDACVKGGITEKYRLVNANTLSLNWYVANTLRCG